MIKIPTVVKCALSIAKDYYKNNYNVNINDKSFEQKLYNWYSNTDIADATVLAAMAIHGEYHSDYTQDLILQITEDIFPNYFEELTAIEEMAKEWEDSQNGEDFMY